MEIPHQGPLTAQSHNCPLHHIQPPPSIFSWMFPGQRGNILMLGGEKGREDEWFQCDSENFLKIRMTHLFDAVIKLKLNSREQTTIRLKY